MDDVNELLIFVSKFTSRAGFPLFINITSHGKALTASKTKDNTIKTRKSMFLTNHLLDVNKHVS